jgi:hypothetical protein
MSEFVVVVRFLVEAKDAEAAMNVVDKQLTKIPLFSEMEELDS